MLLSAYPKVGERIERSPACLVYLFHCPLNGQRECLGTALQIFALAFVEPAPIHLVLLAWKKLIGLHIVTALNERMTGVGFEQNLKPDSVYSHTIQMLAGAVKFDAAALHRQIPRYILDNFLHGLILWKVDCDGLVFFIGQSLSAK